MLHRLLLSSVAAGALAACGTGAVPPDVTANERILTGIAPANSDRVLAIDADGRAFDAAPAIDGAFSITIDSARPVSLFVVGNGATRVLRIASAPGAAPSLTSMPGWTGTVDTAHLSTCDCNEDGVDEEVEAEENPLDQIDGDDDGQSDLDDADDDNDGENDDVDNDDDGDGHDDGDSDLDGDDDGRPDMCDDDDDNDGEHDDVDDDENDDHDDDGVNDDDDADDDNDGTDDDEDEDDGDNNDVDDDDDDGIDD